MGPEWGRWVDDELAGVRAAGRWREVRDFDYRGPVGRLDGGDREVVSFAANDYLGLSCHPSVVAAAGEALDRWGAGAGAARLVTGSRPVHSELERALAAWKGEDSALLFPTGYAANVGVLTAFGRPGARILSDERNHASIVDGCRLACAEVCVYRHGDMDHLESLLGASAAPAIVVTETVFSMDGDAVAVDEVAEACDRHRALLVLDEAHAVFGPHRAVAGDHLRVGTLSKALGSMGGFVAGPRSFVELLVNRARPSIFSTALSPAAAAAALAALGVAQGGEGDALRARLRAHVDRVAPGRPGAIVPVVVGGESAALAASAALLERGLYVPAIRPPTVPPGTSRLRVTLSAAHSDDQVGALVSGLHGLGLHPSASPRRPPARKPETRGRPGRLVVCVGTATGVGKTWVGAAVLGRLRDSGARVAARKPAQSFAAGEGPTDAEVLATATGEVTHAVCPPHRSYSVPMAPPMAAEVLGRPPFRVADLVTETTWAGDVELGWVETVGGPASPVAVDGDSAALAAVLAPDLVVLVAEAGLGAVNAVLLSAGALSSPPVVFLNRYDAGEDLHRRNRTWLEAEGLEVMTTVDALADLVGARRATPS